MLIVLVQYVLVLVFLIITQVFNENQIQSQIQIQIQIFIVNKGIQPIIQHGNKTITKYLPGYCNAEVGGGQAGGLWLAGVNFWFPLNNFGLL